LEYLLFSPHVFIAQRLQKGKAFGTHKGFINIAQYAACADRALANGGAEKVPSLRGSFGKFHGDAFALRNQMQFPIPANMERQN
jgi:hypothetical protein